MNTARNASATTMPIVRTFARWAAGTAKLPMMIRNTNRLSTERLSSTTYPVKYCAPRSQPLTKENATPNSTETRT
jgi:hypothetical protein